jgi:hypothetical protein
MGRSSYSEYMVIPAEDSAALSRYGKTLGISCRVAGCQEPFECVHYADSDSHVPLPKAEEVLEHIKAQWPVSDGWSHEDLFMTSHEHEELPEGNWAIAWEGGPEDWTYLASPEVPGVIVSAYSHWLLTVCPA